MSPEKRRESAQKNREKIMESAISLFQQKGFDNVTIDEIGREAGLSRGTFYKLFISKEDIVVSYMARWNDLYEAYYREELAHSRHDALEQIELLLRYMLLSSTRGGQAFQRIAIASGMRDRVLAEKISKADAKITRILRGLLSDGMEKGIITDRYPVEEWIRMCFAVLEGIALRWAGGSDDGSIEQAMGRSLEMLIHMMRACPHGEKAIEGGA